MRRSPLRSLVRSGRSTSGRDGSKRVLIARSELGVLLWSFLGRVRALPSPSVLRHKASACRVARRHRGEPTEEQVRVAQRTVKLPRLILGPAAC